MSGDKNLVSQVTSYIESEIGKCVKAMEGKFEGEGEDGMDLMYERTRGQKWALSRVLDFIKKLPKEKPPK